MKSMKTNQSILKNNNPTNELVENEVLKK